MTVKKTAYDLIQSQVYTPSEIVRLFWKITARHRPSLGSVLDMGAGDGRFAREGIFDSYRGVEIDRGRVPISDLPQNASISYGCVFRNSAKNFSACIGNPPYVRHHHIETRWRDRVINSITSRLGVKLDQRANLFLYFLCLGLIKSGADGLVSMIVPFEWVSRPSGKPLREFLQKAGWAVTVYRFQEPVFVDVLTTSSITIIDKSEKNSTWRFFDIDRDLAIRPRPSLSGTTIPILPYEKRSDIWALRGLSPGSQNVFTVTEWERLHHGLRLTDVRPCVTSLRHFPSDVSDLTKITFRKYFVEAGRRCWLIKSDGKISKQLARYLAGAPASVSQNYTCAHRECWYRYNQPPKPKLLVSSGFVSFGPKVVKNTVGATAVGSVYGIHTKLITELDNLRGYIAAMKLEDRVVPHAGALRKVEVKQLNGILTSYLEILNARDK